MKRVSALAIGTLLLFLFQCRQSPRDVAIDELVNQHESWNGKEIALSGYAVITGEFEDAPKIWKSKEDAAKRDLAPYLKIARLSQKYPRENWKSPYMGMVQFGVFLNTQSMIQLKSCTSKFST